MAQLVQNSIGAGSVRGAIGPAAADQSEQARRYRGDFVLIRWHWAHAVVHHSEHDLLPLEVWVRALQHPQFPEHDPERVYVPGLLQLEHIIARGAAGLAGVGRVALRSERGKGETKNLEPLTGILS